MGLIRTALRSKPVAALASPHTVDHWLTQVHPLLTVDEVRGRVVAVTPETGAASTVTIRPTGNWRGFRPGQHVNFGVEVGGARKVRCFSVSSSDRRRGRSGTFTVSVKAHPDGFVSQFVHRALTPGTLVHLSQASGDFVLPAVVPEHVLLISGGSGITPVMSMLRSLVDRGHVQGTGRVTFLHYARTAEDEMFSRELDALTARGTLKELDVEIVRVHTREGGSRFTPDQLTALGLDPATTSTWACGPAGLIDVIRDAYAAAGASDQLTVEYFKTPTIDLSAAALEQVTGTLRFDASDVEADNDGRTILEQAEAAGLTPEFGCRMGVCGTCTTQKKYGAVRHVVTGAVSATTDEPIKPCVSLALGDVCVDL